MSLPALCIRRPVMTTLLSAALVVFGLFAFRLLPVAALPRVDFPTITVTATLAGASPEVMASSVALPLEKQFSTIDGVDDISSVSTIGSSQITLQFNLDRDIDAAALDVQSAISVASKNLPTQMTTPPSFRKINPADQPIVYLTLNSPSLPLSQLNEYAETQISPRLSTLSGVAQVMIYGSQKFAIRIRFDPTELANRDLTPLEVEQAIVAADSNVPTGTISTDRQQITIESNDQMTKAADYEKLVVAWRNGAPVTLRDIASVSESVENDRIATWYSGTRAIVLAVQRQPGANTVAVADAVTGLLPMFRAQLPQSVNLGVMLDRSVSIRESVRDVEFTLVLTIGLVVMVIFLFLRNLTATLVPAVVLPVSLVGTFAVMWLLNFSIDNLSLMALTLAVGFVVDDAIVMLENIVRHIEAGESVLDAAFKGSGEIGFTIISITISLIAAFIPVLFMSGVVGRLFHEFAVTISVAILVSGLVSLTLTPMMCSRFLRAGRGEARPEKSAREEGGRLFRLVLRGYELSLDVVLRHRLVMLAITFATLAATVWLFGAVPKGFFPIEDTGLIQGITEASDDTSFTAMAARQKVMADIIQKDPDVEAVNSTAGAGGPNPVMNNGRLFIILKPHGVRQVTTAQAIQRLRKSVAGVPGLALYMQPVQNITIGAKVSKALYQYTVQATNLGDLFQWTPVLEQRIRALPGLQDVSSDLKVHSPVLRVDVDRERAAALGISLDAVRNTLYDGFGTKQISTIYTPSNSYQVIMEVSPEQQQSPTVLSRLYLRANTGKLVPLDSVARLVTEAGPVSVSHEGQMPSSIISFNLAPGTALGDATQAISQVERELNLPASVTTSFQGTAQVFQSSLSSLGMLILAAVLVVYIVLGVLYESFIHPLTILSGLPSAAVGALLTLMLFRTDLSVISIIGIVMLIGIVKKNAIMMIDFAVERRHQGHDPLDSIREACLLRFRPIMMTTMAALMGALPIALGLGAGAELRQPLGLAVVGGLCVSQVLTLYITPVIYLYLEGLSGLLTRRRGSPAVPEGAE